MSDAKKCPVCKMAPYAYFDDPNMVVQCSSPRNCGMLTAYAPNHATAVEIWNCMCDAFEARVPEQQPKIVDPHEIRHADLWPGFYERFENVKPGDCIVVNEYEPGNLAGRIYTGASVTVRVESVRERPVEATND